MQRYNILSDYLKSRFGEKIYKLPIDAGFSCPNREHQEGCVFCSDVGSGEFTVLGSISEQIEQQMKRLQNKKANKYIAYFQSFTNTYGPVDLLRRKYEQVLKYKEVKVLDIATRADCLNNDVLDLLTEMSKKIEVWVEIGLQTTNDKTAEKIRRNYQTSLFFEKQKALQQRGIQTIAHVIAGLPGESEDDFLNTIEALNNRSLFGVKMHSLFIQKNAPLYKKYQLEPFLLLEKEEYVDLVVKAIERLEPQITIHRITGDPDKKMLYKPLWTKDKLSVIGEIQHELKIRNTYQGKVRKENL